MYLPTSVAIQFFRAKVQGPRKHGGKGTREELMRGFREGMRRVLSKPEDVRRSMGMVLGNRCQGCEKKKQEVFVMMVRHMCPVDTEQEDVCEVKDEEVKLDRREWTK